MRFVQTIQAVGGLIGTILTIYGRARATQIVSVLNSYGFRPLVMELYVQRVSIPARGRAADEARIVVALPDCARCLQALAALQADGEYLAGDTLSLADLHDIVEKAFR